MKIRFILIFGIFYLLSYTNILLANSESEHKAMSKSIPDFSTCYDTKCYPNDNTSRCWCICCQECINHWCPACSPTKMQCNPNYPNVCNLEYNSTVAACTQCAAQHCLDGSGLSCLTDGAFERNSKK